MKKPSKKSTDSKQSEMEGLLVRDIAVSYGISLEANSTMAYNSNWESFFNTTQKGVLASEIEKLLEIGPFRAEFYSEALDISTKTLDRYKADRKRFNPNDSELVLKWKALYEQGKEVFETYDSFGSWLQKPAFGLNSIVPKELMKTSRGVDLIMEELLRIEWGQNA